MQSEATSSTWWTKHFFRRCCTNKNITPCATNCVLCLWFDRFSRKAHLEVFYSYVMQSRVKVLHISYISVKMWSFINDKSVITHARTHIVVRVCQLQRGATAISGMCDGTLWAVFRNSMLTTHTYARRHTQSYTLPRQTCGCAKNTILRSYIEVCLFAYEQHAQNRCDDAGGERGGDACVLCPHHWQTSCWTLKWESIAAEES